MADQQNIYYVANHNYGIQPRQLNDTAVADMLVQAESKLANLNFSWMKFEKPKPVANNPAQVPDDGYIWQDQEQVKKVKLDNKEMEVYTRDEGLVPGELVCTVMKKRYRLTSVRTQLQFVHYLPIDSQAAKSAVSQAAINAAKLKQKQKIKSMSSTIIPHGDFGNSDKSQGDDLDMLTARDMATIRYRRNHMYMAEILSSATISDVYRGNRPLFSKDAKEVQEKYKLVLDKLDGEIKALETEHSGKVKEFKESSKQIFGEIEQVSHMKTKEELSRSLSQFAASNSLKVVPASKVMKVRITSGQ